MTDDIAVTPKQQLTETEAKPVKTRAPSKRLQEAIRLLGTGECKTQRAAAERLGMSETYLSEALRKPEIQIFMQRYVRQTIATGSVRAAHRVVELIDAGSEHVSLDAAKHALAIEGHKPASEPGALVNINLQAGFVIDLSEPSEAIDVTPNERGRE